MLKTRTISLSAIFLLIFLIIIWYENIIQIENLRLNALIRGMIIFLLIIYLVIDFLSHNNRDRYHYLLLVPFLILLVFTYTMVIANSMYFRLTQDSTCCVHDNPIALEEAVKFLLDGKNPYSQDFLNTPLAWWGEGKIVLYNGEVMENPAIYHFIPLPFHLLFSVPFYQASNLILGWYDQRFVYIFSLIISLLVLYLIPKQKDDKMLLLILIGLYPFFFGHFAEGRNDIFVFTWLLLSIYFLRKERLRWSLVFLAFACTSKHVAWLILPFYFCYIYYKYRLPESSAFQNISRLLKKTLVFFIIILVLVLPFLVWDLNSFIDDIYRYPAGLSETSYPINGLGFSMMIWALNWVPSVTSYFPFWIFQLVFGIPVLFYLLKLQKKYNTLSQVVANYAFFLFVFFFFSRFFLSNYLIFVVMLLIVSYFISPQKRVAHNVYY